MNINDRKNIDKMQFDLQKYFSEIDQTHESQSYKDIDDAHRYMQKMIDDVKNMDGKIFIAEEKDQIIGFIQGVIIEHEKGADTFYDLTHNPSKEGWVGLLFVKPEYRGGWYWTTIAQRNEKLFYIKKLHEYTTISLI